MNPQKTTCSVNQQETKVTLKPKRRLCLWICAYPIQRTVKKSNHRITSKTCAHLLELRKMIRIKSVTKALLKAQTVQILKYSIRNCKTKSTRTQLKIPKSKCKLMSSHRWHKLTQIPKLQKFMIHQCRILWPRTLSNKSNIKQCKQKTKLRNNLVQIKLKKLREITRCLILSIQIKWNNGYKRSKLTMTKNMTKI